MVELLVVVVIMGILAATVPPMITRYAAEKRGELHVADFYMEMNSLRAKVLKGGAPVITTFDFDNSTYSVYIDSNSNSTADSAELQNDPDKPSIVFGLPNPVPAKAPPGVDDLSQVSESWKSGIVVNNNSTLSIPAGHLYLQNSAKAEQGYCLLVAPGETEVQLFKWNGSKWYKY